MLFTQEKDGQLDNKTSSCIKITEVHILLPEYDKLKWK